MDSTQVSGFWLNRVTPEEWSEIDIIEVPAGLRNHATIFQPNVHYFHGPHYKGTLKKDYNDPSRHDLGFKLSGGFHLYGLEWSPTAIRWYVDGKLMREMHNGLFFQPLHMNINVEANPFLEALPDDNSLPAVYLIDYARTWRQKDY